MKHPRSWILAMTLTSIGCEEKPAPAPTPPPAPAPIVEPAPAPSPAPSADAEAARAEEQAKKAKEEAAMAESPLVGCCRSLGQKGFMERSPEYMGASQVCGEALQEKKELASVLPEIKKALKGKPLPDTCAK